DPRGPRRWSAIEGHEIKPGPAQAEADTMRVDDLHGGDALLQELRGRALVAFEGEFHVLRSDRLAVVEPHALTQAEFVDEPVGRGTPRLGKTRRHRIAGQGLYHRVVDHEVEDEGGDERLGLGGIEPPGRGRDVEHQGHLAFWAGACWHGHKKSEKNEERYKETHDIPL